MMTGKYKMAGSVQSSLLGRVNGYRIEFCSLVCVCVCVSICMCVHLYIRYKERKLRISAIPIILIDRVQSVTFIMLARLELVKRKEKKNKARIFPLGLLTYSIVLLLPQRNCVRGL